MTTNSINVDLPMDVSQINFNLKIVERSSQIVWGLLVWLTNKAMENGLDPSDIQENIPLMFSFESLLYIMDRKNNTEQANPKQCAEVLAQYLKSRNRYNNKIQEHLNELVEYWTAERKLFYNNDSVNLIPTIDDIHRYIYIRWGDIRTLSQICYFNTRLAVDYEQLSAWCNFTVFTTDYASYKDDLAKNTFNTYLVIIKHDPEHAIEKAKMFWNHYKNIVLEKLGNDFLTVLLANQYIVKMDEEKVQIPKDPQFDFLK